MKKHKRQIRWHRTFVSLLAILVVMMSGPLPMAMSQTRYPAAKAVVNHPAMPPSIRHASRKVAIIKPKLSFSKDPTDVEISTARVFLESLVPTTSTAVSGENLALAKALLAFRGKQNKDDVSDLTSFIKAYPKSRWSPSLELSLGDLRYENGYLTEALTHWQAAWDGSKLEKSSSLHAMADQAIGHILALYARLGHKADLEKLIPEIQKRGVSGAAQADLFDASQGLGTMKNHPEIAFKCGPYAVNSLLNLGRNTEAVNPLLAKAVSTTRGTNLAQVKKLADAVGLQYQIAYRKPGSDFVVPSIMHLKLEHFTAVMSQHGNWYQTKDPIFGRGHRDFTRKAMEMESDGYFLIPAGPLPAGWRAVTIAEAEKIWGKGAPHGMGDNCHTNDSPKVSPGGPNGCKGMASASIFSSTATLNIRDVPVGYHAPIGPEMDFLINYNWGELHQPSTFAWPTLGYNWSLNWVSYLTVGQNEVFVRVRGGGYEDYLSDEYAFDNVTPIYKPILNSHAVLNPLGNGVYQRLSPDGTIEVYNQPDGSGRIFLTEVIDPQGNSATVQYDADFRITTITDAIGQATTLTYVSNTLGNPGFYYISQITDPFSRSATFTYDASGTQLTKITDVIGLQSQFMYDGNTSTILTMMTPYGSTSFWQYYPPASDIPAGIRFGLPDGSAAVVESWGGPQWSSYYWDREAMMMYPTDPSSLDHTHCYTTKWTLSSAGSMSNEPSWIKPALESKISYVYQNETGDGADEMSTTNGAPIQISRPLDSGIQVYQFQNNSFGYPTQSIDPMGRTFSYLYAGNNIDLLEARQTRGSNNDLVSKYIYNAQHRPLVKIDGSGQRTEYAYNSFGEPTTITDANNNITTLTYDSDGYLTQIQGPLAGTGDVTDIAYDGYGRVYTVTDSEGYVVTYSYDDMDRVTQVSYPDGTSEQTTYDRLDAVLKKDRLGRTTQYSYNNMDQLIAETDPLGRTTKYGWCTCGSLRSLTDPAGNKTCWQRDLEGRVTQKTFPDGSTYSYVYEDSTSRLKQRIDAFTPTPQTTNYEYNPDNTLSQVSYTNAINATSTVNYSYDAVYPRVLSTSNGWGTYTNNYYANTANPYGAAYVTIGGSVHTGDIVSIVFNNSTLAGGTHTVNYTVTSGDTTLTILAASVAAAITADSTLAAAGISATSTTALVTINAPAQIGVLTLVPSVSGSGHTVTATNNLSLICLNLAGPTTVGDVINTTVVNTGLSGGQRNVQYTVVSGDVSPAALATSVGAALNADSVLSTAGYSATVSGSQILISPPANVGPVSLKTSTNGVTTETFSANPAVGDPVIFDIFDAGLPNGVITKTYTTTSTNASTAAAAVAALINADGTLTAAGITATSSGSAISLTSTSVNGTAYRALCNPGVAPFVSFIETGGTTEVASSTVASGAGRLMSVTNDVIANSAITYVYDALGRTTNRSINGSTNASNWGYDAMSRITSETNTLGSFGYTYVDDTSGSSKGTTRLASIAYPNSQTTNFSYLPNIGDQRLQQIVNLNPSSAVLSQFNYAYDPAGQIKQWQQQQNSTNNHYDLGYDSAGQVTSATSDSGSSFKAYISGTPHTGDVVSVTAYDASLTGSAGQESASYTVASGNTASTIATNLASNITTAMSNIGVTASATGAVVTISTSSSYTTQFTSAVTGTGATTTIALSGSNPIPNLHKQFYYSYDSAGNRTGAQGDSTGSFPSGLTTTATRATYNCLNQITSTSAGGPIAFEATTTNPVKSAVVNVTQTATIGGTVTTGDVLWLGVHDRGLSHSENVSYTVVGGDTTTTIATALKNAINADTTLSTLGVTATSSGAVITISSASVNATAYTQALSSGATESISLNGASGTMATIGPSNAFTASPSLASGTNTASVTAVSGGGTATTNTYPITIGSATSTTPTHDANGNMTSDGTNSYAWDAENRLIKITYPGTNNYSSFTYDGFGRRAKIVETVAGSVTSTKQFVWCSRYKPDETRDGSSAITVQYFGRGQTIGGTTNKYFYNKDHLGSVRELTDSSGAIQAQYSYDPYGNATKLQGSLASDFQYAGYYFHAPSGLNLTRTRAYNAGLGRFMNRDPIGIAGGINLFGYVANNPVGYKDPSGTSMGNPDPAPLPGGSPWAPPPAPPGGSPWAPPPAPPGGSPWGPPPKPPTGFPPAPPPPNGGRTCGGKPPRPPHNGHPGVFANSGDKGGASDPGLGEPGGKGGNPGTGPADGPLPPTLPPYEGPTPSGGDDAPGTPPGPFDPANPHPPDTIHVGDPGNIEIIKNFIEWLGGFR